MNTTLMERPRTNNSGPAHDATIVVAYVNEPKGGQKSASIKDMDGIYYWIKPEWQSDFAPGASYRIRFTIKEANGYTNRNVQAYEPANEAASRTPPRSQPTAPQRSAPVNQHVPPPHNASPQNGNNNNGNGGGYYRPTSPKDSRRMFICSQMNALIQSHQIAPLNAQSIADAIAMLAEAYNATLGQEDAA